MDIENLIRKIESNCLDEAIEIIEEIGLNKNNEAVPHLIKILKNTLDGNLRNATALALSDIGDSRAVPPIIEMLKDPKTLGNRGTLLYALEPFDYTNHIELLVEFLCTGNFEVSRNSYILMESLSKDILPETIERCISKIKDSIEESKDRVDFLSEALDMLIQKKCQKINGDNMIDKTPKVFKFSEDNILKMLTEYIAEKIGIEEFSAKAILLGTSGEDLRYVSIIADASLDLEQSDLINIDNNYSFSDAIHNCENFNDSAAE